MRLDVGLDPKYWGDLLVVGVKVTEGAYFGSLGSVKVTCALWFQSSAESTCVPLSLAASTVPSQSTSPFSNTSV